MDLLNHITLEEVCDILKVKDLRSLQSSKGFPKPVFKDDKIMFKKDKIKKLFNIDNLEEPFMTMKDAEFVDIKEAQLQYYASINRVPSYRLKSAKGSGYLFRKSELEKFKTINIVGNTDFVNQLYGTEMIKDLFVTFIEQFKDTEKEREYEFLKLYFFEQKNFSDIGKKYNLSRERVRQIFEKTFKRMKERIISLTKENVLELERKNLHQKIEIEYLRNQLHGKSKKEEVDYDYQLEQLSSTSEIFIDFLKKDLMDEDLSVRALNTLKYSDSFTLYDLLTKFNNYNDNIKSLIKIRNMGRKTFDEIKEFISEKEMKLEYITGVSAREFLLNKPETTKNLLLFQQVHEKMSLIKLNQM